MSIIKDSSTFFGTTYAAVLRFGRAMMLDVLKKQQMKATFLILYFGPLLASSGNAAMESFIKQTRQPSFSKMTTSS